MPLSSRGFDSCFLDIVNTIIQVSSMETVSFHAIFSRLCFEGLSECEFKLNFSFEVSGTRRCQLLV
jgi:hypothetical protein